MSNRPPGFSTFIKLRDDKNLPLDSVAVIVNDPNNASQKGFGTAGWDGIFKYFTIPNRNNEEIQMHYSRFMQHPILSISFGSKGIVFVGLANGQIMAIDMQNDQSACVGFHEAPISHLFWIEKYSLLGSLGYDFKLKFWSMENGNGKDPAKQFILPCKTHVANFDFPYLLIGTADSKMCILSMDKLPNINIPDEKGWFDIIQFGSKFQACKIVARIKTFAFGCIDGRCVCSAFEESYQGEIKPTTDTSKRMTSKSMRRQSYSNYGGGSNYGVGTSTTNYYCQVNDIDIGIDTGQQYLMIAGTEEISFFNILKKEKPRSYKGKVTAARISIDGKYLIFSEGNDWCQGLNDLKKSTKPRLQAIKFSRTELESLVKK